MNAPGQENNETIEKIVIGGLAAVASVGAIIFLGAHVASRLFGGGRLNAGFGEAISATFKLPSHSDEPKLAWPKAAQATLPGPVAYWFSTFLIFLIFAVAFGVYISRKGRDDKAGMLDRKRLGVDTQARLAKPREMAPMIVPGPTTGRFLLGRVGKFLVATENRQAQEEAPVKSRFAMFNRDAEERRGDRSAVAILGPTRCGKTANIISGILDWDGPVILSSVKSDLLDATAKWRRNMGDVMVFDPTHSTNEQTAHWSPLRAAHTVVGAQKAARALCDASPKGGVEQADFWASLSERLLWPLLWTAAVSGRTMNDVVRWVLTEDRPQDETQLGEIGGILKGEMRALDPVRRDEAEKAWQQMVAVWGRDSRTRSSIYATAETVIAAWSDPGVAESAMGQDIDLEWLMGGQSPRSLYLCAPAHEQARLSPVFGGLLGDLFQQAYELAGRQGQLSKPLLIVMDEAGNTPCKWLPGYASTCSGIGIQMVTVWQSKSQIDQAYGKLGDSVLTNHGTKIFYSGISDPSTLKYAAELLGEEEVLTRSINEAGKNGKSVNESTTRAQLVPADILRQVAPGQALLLHGTLRPAHMFSRPYFSDKRLSMKSKGVVPVAKGAKTAGLMPTDGTVWGRKLKNAPAPNPSQNLGRNAAAADMSQFGFASTSQVPAPPTSHIPAPPTSRTPAPSTQQTSARPIQPWGVPTSSRRSAPATSTPSPSPFNDDDIDLTESRPSTSNVSFANAMPQRASRRSANGAPANPFATPAPVQDDDARREQAHTETPSSTPDAPRPYGLFTGPASEQIDETNGWSRDRRPKNR